MKDLKWKSIELLKPPSIQYAPPEVQKMLNAQPPFRTPNPDEWDFAPSLTLAAEETATGAILTCGPGCTIATFNDYKAMDYDEYQMRKLLTRQIDNAMGSVFHYRDRTQIVETLLYVLGY